MMDLAEGTIEWIKRTVAIGANDDEVRLLLVLAKKYGLDPLLKEIWCIKPTSTSTDGKGDNVAPAVIMTSRDGYLKIAQADVQFDGMQSFVVREGDQFEVDAQAGTVLHKFGVKRGRIMGAWACCYHKKRRPAIAFVDFDEYNSASPVWRRYPSAMIQKVAEVFVLKRQFGISGLVTQEEVSGDVAVNLNHESDSVSLGSSSFTGPSLSVTVAEVQDDRATRLEAMRQLKAFADKKGIKRSELRAMVDLESKGEKVPSLVVIERIKQQLEML